jgi:hypothetical protein
MQNKRLNRVIQTKINFSIAEDILINCSINRIYIDLKDLSHNGEPMKKGLEPVKEPSGTRRV